FRNARCTGKEKGRSSRGGVDRAPRVEAGKPRRQAARLRPALESRSESARRTLGRWAASGERARQLLVYALRALAQLFAQLTPRFGRRQQGDSGADQHPEGEQAEAGQHPLRGAALRPQTHQAQQVILVQLSQVPELHGASSSSGPASPYPPVLCCWPPCSSPRLKRPSAPSAMLTSSSLTNGIAAKRKPSRSRRAVSPVKRPPPKM